GVVLVLLSVVHGEHLPTVVSGRSIAALAYLVVFGSLVAYTAYLYLLAKVPVPVASSYAYVNPLVALALGAAFYGERLPGALIVSVPLILTAVALVLRPAPTAAASPAPALRPRSELDAPAEGESRRGPGVRSLERRRLAGGADEGEHPLVSRL